MARGERWRAAATVLAVVTLVLTWTRLASAHAVGLSRGEYTVSEGRVEATLTFARRDVEGLESSALLRGVVVRMAGEACPGSVASARRVEPDAFVWELRFTCPRASGPTDLELPILADLPDGHRHAARVVGGARVVEEVLYRSHAALEAPVNVRTEAVGVDPGPGHAAGVGFVRMGVEHILTGYDHLLFLFALIVVGGRLRATLRVVTAFTVGHSISLAVATIGIYAPPAWIVEPAIALSIVYVGAENWFVRDIEGRWRVTFPFGVVHGFGFAGALREVGLPHDQLPLALLAFNSGVELGQVSIVAAMLPLIALLRGSERLRGGGVRALSAMAGAAGLVWFVLRVT